MIKSSEKVKVKSLKLVLFLVFSFYFLVVNCFAQEQITRSSQIKTHVIEGYHLKTHAIDDTSKIAPSVRSQLGGTPADESITDAKIKNDDYLTKSLGYALRWRNLNNQLYFGADSSFYLDVNGTREMEILNNGSWGIQDNANELFMLNASGTRGDPTSPVRGIRWDFTNDNRTSSTGIYLTHQAEGDSSRDHIATYQGQAGLTGAGDMNYMYGLYHINTNNGTGTLGAAYGLYINAMSGTGTTTNNYGIYVKAQTHGTNKYAIVTGQNNVGFGTYTPAAALHVQTAYQTDAKIRLQQTSENYWDFNIGADSTDLQIGDVGNLDMLTIKSSGRLGFGQTGSRGPDQLAHFISANGTSAYLRLQQLSQNYWDIGNTASQTYFRITSSGGQYFQVAATGDVTGTHGTYHTSSDRRLKKNIKTIDNALDKVLNLRGVTYEWIDSTKDHGEGTKIGLIAQEVNKVIPEVVTVQDDSMQTMNIQYDVLNSLLIEAIKKQQTEILIHRYALIFLFALVVYFKVKK